MPPPELVKCVYVSLDGTDESEVALYDDAIAALLARIDNPVFPEHFEQNWRRMALELRTLEMMEQVPDFAWSTTPPAACDVKLKATTLAMIVGLVMREQRQ